MTRSRRTALAVTGLLLAVGAGAGCAAGQNAETSVQYQVTDGVVADVGAIGMRDMYIYSGSDDGIAPGETGYIRTTIYNGGTNADTLVGARADEGQITIETGGATLSPTSSPLPLPSSTQSFPEGQTGSGVASPSATAGTSVTPKPAESLQASPTSPPPPAEESASITLPATTVVRFGDPSGGLSGPFMKFTNTTGKPMFNGTSIAITFTFRDAGSVAVLVPVENPLATTLTATPVPSPTEVSPTLIVPPGGSPTPSPSASPGPIRISISPSVAATAVPPPVTPTP